jgi:hypothetical protein
VSTQHHIYGFACMLLSDGARRIYGNGLRAFAAWLEEDLDPAWVTSNDAHRYKKHLIKVGRAPATINSAVVSLLPFAQ